MHSVTRRRFVTSSLATGFALAVRPVAAETITTDTVGLVAGEVKIPNAGFEVPGYRAMPAGKGPFPVVLVVQEIFGVHEHIRDMCRRFAKIGYLAIAPELYARQGDVGAMKDIQEIISKVVNKVPDAQVMSDLDATAEYAKKSGKMEGDKLFITGFCWGGRSVWLYSAHNPKVKAGAAWYGRISGPPNAFQTKYPIDVAANLKVPVIGLYGALDTGIPLAHVELMRTELAKGKSGSDIIVYPGAQHAFNADYRPSFNAEAAKDAWQRLREWFKAHGA